MYPCGQENEKPQELSITVCPLGKDGTTWLKAVQTQTKLNGITRIMVGVIVRSTK